MVLYIPGGCLEFLPSTVVHNYIHLIGGRPRPGPGCRQLAILYGTLDTVPDLK